MPGPAAVRAGGAYEQKLHGYRALPFTAVGRGGTVLVQYRVAGPGGGRRGAANRTAWSSTASWSSGTPRRLSFEALQRRAATRARGAPALAVKWPAYFVAFDLLQYDGQELLTRPYADAAPCWTTCSPSTR
ncbi:hypothetical protein Snoj_25670 [Streptomyces nojiriensis]|uniref:Uncharacterized protein n=1 Tax=Streptomyces nojiriensis TaxID=66374 RepID=A0ABQ3SKH5_9ACTN|nr:hypothetical protein [Streptomyces nojiriensis]QTI50241.1 hypothetical protein JYK04_08117 [Streptomyces nojiriensis]GGS29349.1 hypothetical protein GCM10010205_69270 [Streptomyces nojiriensis]GHI68649.1 hypothetical protein Snoj_25670 [Streptomyces nojiriensis]